VNEYITGQKGAVAEDGASDPPPGGVLYVLRPVGHRESAQTIGKTLQRPYVVREYLTREATRR
jgi:hypothetical protein